MLAKRWVVASLVGVAGATAILAVYMDAQPYEIGNGATLIAEIGVGISIAIIVYYFSSKSDAEIKGVIESTKRITEEQVKLKKRQTAKARQELVENLNSISKCTKLALYVADMHARYTVLNDSDDVIGVMCNNIRAHIDDLDKLNTADYSFFSTSDKGRLHGLKMWSDKPVGDVDRVKFCNTVGHIVDNWLKSMIREGANFETIQAGDELVISTAVDRRAYPIGGTVYAKTKVKPLNTRENIHCQVFDQKGNRLWSKEIGLKDGGHDSTSTQNTLETSFRIEGPEWTTERKYTFTATHRGQSASTEFLVNHHVPVIESDKETYKCPSNIIIKVTDPDSDKDGRSVESIGDRPDSNIIIESDLGKIDGYKLVETGPNTGVFQGTVKIVAEGELQPAESSNTAHATHGTANDGGIIVCKGGEEIRIRYTNGTDMVELTTHTENSDGCCSRPA